jgi:hypothetical protein
MIIISLYSQRDTILLKIEPHLTEKKHFLSDPASYTEQIEWAIFIFYDFFL